MDFESIEKPMRALAVHFKDEDWDGLTDQAMGPVWFYTADNLTVPAYILNTDEHGPTTGWMMKNEAIKLANHFDLEFEEV